jgi:hypothetical protein
MVQKAIVGVLLRSGYDIFTANYKYNEYYGQIRKPVWKIL